MADEIYENPRLAAIYDPFDPDRSDLDAYESMVHEFGARSVLDIGCGTGTFACRLAARGVQVVGLEPAFASLQVAQSKTGSDRVTWIHGTARDLPALKVDLATMTANVAQVFLTDEAWTETLRSVRNVLVPGGRLIFETRRPESQAWIHWTKESTFQRIHIPKYGVVKGWVDVLSVHNSLVSFRWTYVFERDGAIFTSDSTVRFRGLDELVQSLDDAELSVEKVREAPDRPGKEFVLIARRAR
ncbi:class I SAM-dependent methyltransferase [Alicyclobacillus cycloheptanicus]|uniref:SAM-dependent methyltransferase n=1 Tax=Alicyclobacillus cycloheptanicus TaxID=1457 RepID=A0ABT9XEU0_9BACL|nr:class I SAM-dependent methyltransferase [Alicyclobacillus cycloheptanicus]MDQ0188599.1 SAM-dependent methyltransferase [Alicyclobacillus cycloheptanicus]WDM01277.1 class I SAM-dependent methyltransferase [Alicyclobacillus cycloheptanicus]